jgi:hypothetical protein
MNLKLNKDEEKLLREIVFDWYEAFGQKSKSGKWKLEAYTDCLDFAEKFLGYKRGEK